MSFQQIEACALDANSSGDAINPRMLSVRSSNLVFVEAAKALPHIFLLIVGLMFGPVEAAVTCTETVVAVINHENGNVYFTTDQTCGAGWCQVAGNADYVKRGYAMLLAAQLAGRKVSFLWPTITSCVQNPLYSSPQYILNP